METGKISQYKNKNLDEIEFDLNEAVVSDDDVDDANSDQAGE